MTDNEARILRDLRALADDLWSEGQSAPAIGLKAFTDAAASHSGGGLAMFIIVHGAATHVPQRINPDQMVRYADTFGVGEQKPGANIVLTEQDGGGNVVVRVRETQAEIDTLIRQAAIGRAIDINTTLATIG